MKWSLRQSLNYEDNQMIKLFEKYLIKNRNQQLSLPASMLQYSSFYPERTGENLLQIRWMLLISKVEIDK